MVTVVRDTLPQALQSVFAQAFAGRIHVLIGVDRWIGDRVDVGAQACVCRGMLSHTEIGDDVEIGSLVYVSHGVVIGVRSWLSAGTAVAGHARIADAGLLGIGSVVVDNVNLDAGVLVGGGSVVVRHAAAGEKLVGVPAHAVPAMRRFGPTPRG